MRLKGILIILGALSILLMSVFIFATQITTFTNSLTSENLTFNGNQNITRNISIPKNVNVTSATLNLSGYSNNIYQESENSSDTNTTTNYFYENYTKIANSTANSLWQVKFGHNDSSSSPFFYNVSIPQNCWDAYSNVLVFRIYTFRKLGGTDTSYGQCYTGSGWNNITNVSTGSASGFGGCGLPSSWDRINDSNYLTASYSNVGSGEGSQGWVFNCNGNADYAWWYEDAMYWNIYPINPSLYINNSQVWAYSGQFNQTNNKTNDFSSILNTALNNGACNCQNCSLNGTSCLIPFTFHSDTAGILQYSALDVNYNSRPFPNLISPSNNSFTNTQANNFLCNATEVLIPLTNLTLNIWNSTNSLNKTFTEGNVSNHYDFYSNQYDQIIIGTDHSNPFGFNISKNYTFSFWFNRRTDQVASYLDEAILEISDFSLNTLSIGINDSKLSLMVWNGSTSNTVASNQILNLNQWYHGLVTYSSNSSIDIYINGSLTAQGSIPKFGSCDSLNRIGQEGCLDGNHFNGSIDEVRIYNVSLNKTQITTIYNQGRFNESIGSVSSGLIGFYNFNNATQGLDSSGFGNNENLSYNPSKRPSFLSLIELNSSQTLSSTDAYKWNCRAYNNNSQSWWADNNWTLNVDLTNPLISYGTGMELNNTNFSRSYIFVNTSITETNFKNLTFYLYNTSLVNSTTYTDSTRKINFTNLANGLYYFNATTYDQANNVNSTDTRWIRLDTKAPALTLTRPQAQAYGTNLSLPLNYTVSDTTTYVSQCWYKVVNSTSNIIINNLTITNCQNTTFDVPRTDTYTLTLYTNDSLNQLNSSSVTFSVSLTAPAVVLDYPTSVQYLNSGTNVNLNFTATDSDGISQCQLYSNFTGTWFLNQTFTGVISGTQNSTVKNLTDNFYKWNVWCNDTINNNAWALNNLTFYVDTTKPSIVINSITTTAGSQTISFNSTETDSTLNTCKYSIYNSSSGIDGNNENVSMICNSNPHSATVTAYETYTLRVYALDLASNENYSESAFTTSASSGGTSGGGGGSPTGLVSVIAMTIPSNYSELVSNLNRAKIYARIRDSCLNFSSLDDCSLTDEEKSLTIDTLSKQEISLTLEQFNLFFTDFINNKFEELKVSEEDADKFDLFKATLNIATSDFAVTPRTLDQYFLFFSKTPHKILITSNKILSNVSLVSGELGLSANLKTSTTAEITYTPQTLDFTARTIKGKINYISENGESLFQDVQIRAVYLFSPTIIIISIVVISGIIVAVYFSNKKKKLKLFQ